MDERQLVCYPRSGTCSLTGSVCCVLLTFFPFKISSPYSIITTKINPLLTLKASKTRHGQFDLAGGGGGEDRKNDFFFNFHFLSIFGKNLIFRFPGRTFSVLFFSLDRLCNVFFYSSSPLPT